MDTGNSVFALSDRTNFGIKGIYYLFFFFPVNKS